MVIGGELKFENGRWHIDNLSGRSGQRDQDLMEVQYCLHQIAEQFENDMQIKPEIRLNIPGEEFAYL